MVATQDNSETGGGKPAEDVKTDSPAPAPAETPKAEEAPKAADKPAAAAPESRPYGPSGGRGRNDRSGGGGGPRRDNRQGGGRRDNRDNRDGDKPEDELAEKVVFINRCSKVVKGGRRFSFSALLVSGDHKGQVGFGFGKANEVSEAIRKASEGARRNLETMSIVDGTIPHEIYAEYGGGKVLLKPAAPGTGVIAGGGMRAVCEAVGIKDVIGKSLGSNNHANVVKATLKALSELRTREQIMSLRGKKIKEKESL